MMDAELRARGFPAARSLNCAILFGRMQNQKTAMARLVIQGSLLGQAIRASHAWAEGRLGVRGRSEYNTTVKEGFGITLMQRRCQFYDAAPADGGLMGKSNVGG
jgi:hypothetical protein